MGVLESANAPVARATAGDQGRSAWVASPGLVAGIPMTGWPPRRLSKAAQEAICGPVGPLCRP
jgi:hypothetical protein